MKRTILLLLGLFCAGVCTTKSFGQGIYASGAGPINQSMAGASTAAAVDFGSSFWNPATLSFLDREEVLIGSQLVIPSIHFGSGIGAGAINGTLPRNGRYGTARSDAGVLPGLATGASFKLDPDSPMTMGMGIFGVVGGGVNFPGSTSTPVLGPRVPPRYFGLGPQYANLALLEIKPMVSYKFSDRLSLAAAPIVTAGTAQFTPAYFAPGPKDAFGVSTFPTATQSRPFWGGGFQVGLLFQATENWGVGFSYTSPLWQERWNYNTYNPDLSGRKIGTQASIPAVYSWGIAYKGFERTVIDVDMRYFDYANSQLFGTSLSNGGLNWNSIFAVAVGVKHELTDRVSVMAGYLYNGLPIRQPETLFNIQAPAVIQNTLSVGASMRLSENILFTAGWSHGFRNSISGPVLQIPGAIARLDAQTDSILLGLTIQYGAKRTTSTQLPALPVSIGPPSPPSMASIQ